jgi:hypothetical protein
MSEIATTLVSVETKSGQSQKGPWTVHRFKDANGDIFSTFNADLAREAANFLNLNSVIVFEQTEKGRNLSAVRAAGSTQEGNGSEVTYKAVSAAPVTAGTPSDDLVGKIRTHTIGPLAAAMWSDLPEEERTFENAKAIADKLVQWALSNSINY